MAPEFFSEGAHLSFLDSEIERKWLKLIEQEPLIEMSVSKDGKEPSLFFVRRRQLENSAKFEYKVYTDQSLKHLVADVDTTSILDRYSSVAFILVHDDSSNEDGENYRRKGIGTALHNLIERDIRKAGGRGLRPDWASLQMHGFPFWANRLKVSEDDIRLAQYNFLRDRELPESVVKALEVYEREHDNK